MTLDTSFSSFSLPISPEFGSIDFGFGGQGMDTQNLLTSALDSIGIPLAGDIVNGLLSVFGIDLNCFNASFPPEKATKDTLAFIQKVYQDSGLKSVKTSNNFKAIQDAVNHCLKIFDYIAYWRAELAKKRQGCTRDGELTASKIASAEAEKLISEISAVFSNSITTKVSTYSSGFRGAWKQATKHRVMTIFGKKSSVTQVQKDNIKPKTENSNSLSTIAVFASIFLLIKKYL